MRLEPQDIDLIARKTAAIVLGSLAKRHEEEYPELVTTEEAASILHITPQRMRQFKDKYPYISAARVCRASCSSSATRCSRTYN